MYSTGIRSEENVVMTLDYDKVMTRSIPDGPTKPSDSPHCLLSAVVGL